MSNEVRDEELRIWNIEVKWAYQTLPIKPSSQPNIKQEIVSAWKPTFPNLAEIENWLNQATENRKIKQKQK